MSYLKTALVAASALTASFGFATAANAQAFYLQEQSARAAGRAFSGEGADTGAASLWWNPAAIAGIENLDVSLSASAILPRGEVADNGTVIRRPGQAPTSVGGDPVTKNPINNGVLPAFAVAVPLGERLALGLAVSSPYSFTTDYSEDSWARYTADKTKLLTMDIQPSVAYAVTDWLRAGAALNVEYTDASLSNALPNLSAALPDGRQVLKGNGWDLGWSAGVQMHNEFVTVGISYKSAIKHKLEGSIEISGLQGPLAAQNRELDGVTATFYTPAQIIVGARFKVSPALTLNTQGIRYTWSKFDEIRLGAPLNTAIPEGYQNSWSLAGGFDYQASEKLILRAGVQHASTPTVDGERDARVPDADRWNFGAGGTVQVNPRLALDAAFNYVHFDKETIDRTTAAYAGTAAQTPIVVNGTLRDAKAFIISVGGRMTF